MGLSIIFIGILLFVFADIDMKSKLIAITAFLGFCILITICFGYFIFQILVINEKGIQIIFFKKIIKEINWKDIFSIREGNINKNPVYIIKTNNGNELRIDKRKKILNCLEVYYKKDIIK